MTWRDPIFTMRERDKFLRVLLLHFLKKNDKEEYKNCPRIFNNFLFLSSMALLQAFFKEDEEKDEDLFAISILCFLTLIVEVR